MALTPAQQREVDRYGQLLEGTETELERERLRRKRFLKQKFRPMLAATIGDYGDNITDTTRVLVLGLAIARGIVTDADVISAYDGYVESLLDGYGGPTAVLAAIEQVSSALQAQLVGGYYVAKSEIEAAGTVEDVRRVDLPGEPELENHQV